MKTIFTDFEFNNTTKEFVNLVSCVTYDADTEQVTRFWLHNNDYEISKCRAHFEKYDLIIGYACVAEARAVMSLGINPMKFKWIDLFLEYRMMTNHNDVLNWGEQLVDGKVKTVRKPPPKWERSEDDSKGGFKPTHSLAEATFKLTGEIRDTKNKNAMRDLIISRPDVFSRKDRKAILDYNEEDVVFLPKIWAEIKKNFLLLELEHVVDDGNVEKNYIEEAMNRGSYSALTAKMESFGYPIDIEATKNFSSKIPSILAECQRDINSQFEFKPFKWHKKKAKFSWDQKVTKNWVSENMNVENWIKTDKKSLSLSLEAWERHFIYRHDYPRGNFGAQMLRFLKLKQSLYGFSDTGGKRKNFWDSVGPDGRVRPYMNIFGAQSSRSQPAASGFMFLKPAWMRALVQPPSGRFMCGIDYGQQEFFLAALVSKDQAMIDAYMSGDPYLYLGKQAGMIPPEGTKDSHKAERDLMKSTTLGILFGMSKVGLAAKLTADSGNTYDEAEAQELIMGFSSVYSTYIQWREIELNMYESGQSIALADGWRLWANNSNPRSVLNVPIQGYGAVIMRRAVYLADQRGVRINFTLHDALYMEDSIENLDKIIVLRDCMIEAFHDYFEGEMKEAAKHIKLDPFAWGPDLDKDGEIKIKKWVVPTSDLYIDQRSLPDYERFKIYFSDSITDSL